uniref:Uncharacterized protein n=1 Tax=Bubo bubo TaxID=30461 RepID=A0A8C0EQA8_BUBBB
MHEKSGRNLPKSPRRKKREWTIKKKGKNPQLSRTAKLRKDHADVGIFDAVAKGYLSELEKTWRENDIDALNSSSETLLHVAAANGHLMIMEYLISKGAKTDVKDRKGRTPLHRAAEKGHGDAVKMLLQHGAYMYSLDTEGKTPLHLAAQKNHSHIVKMILKEEARSYRNKHNFLHMAALKDESRLAKMLLKAGASTEGKDERGQTALSYAVSQGSENTAKVLLEAGASVDSNMAERALNSNHPSIFKILLEYSKDLPSDIMESALFRAVQKNLHGIVAALIDRGADINACNEIQYTPLLLACGTGKAESAEVLIKKGANFRIKTPASDTALHLAVQAGAASLTNLLLHKGMGINLRNQADETPLHVAALHNQGALVGLLVNAGAQINAVTKELFTPLHIEYCVPKTLLTLRCCFQDAIMCYTDIQYRAGPSSAISIPNFNSYFSIFHHTTCLDFAILSRCNENNHICHLLISLSNLFQHKDDMFRIKRLQQSLLVQNICTVVS